VLAISGGLTVGLGFIATRKTGILDSLLIYLFHLFIYLFIYLFNLI
jgi:hypothetical protein